MLTNDFISAIEAAWSEDTAAPDNTWSATNPAVGHCDVTSLLVRERVGGDLSMVQVFRKGEFSEHHFWNVLQDGTTLDLTASQFDGSETFSEPSLLDDAFFEKSGPMNAELVNRLEVFRSRVYRASAPTE